jgi:putative hydrolase of the HAD superfamily
VEQYKHIIFDLGGVLIELGDTPIPEELLRQNNKITVNEWHSLPVAHQFERGKVGAVEFAEKIINEFDLKISVHDFLQFFSKWPKSVYPGTEEILVALGRNHDLSILSNCNELHWPIMKNTFGILKYFNRAFSSHLIGLTKPDTAIFNYVLSQLQANPSDVLYFDDNEKNVESAISIGIKGIQVKGITGVRRYLQSIDLI